MTRAFTKNENKPSDLDRRQFMSRPSQNLENFGEIPHQIASQQQFDSNEERPTNIDDNVIIGNIDGSETTTTSTSGIDHGFLGNVLRILGMDSGKIGAFAINGIIFIAQMVCKIKAKLLAFNIFSRYSLLSIFFSPPLRLDVLLYRRLLQWLVK